MTLSTLGIVDFARHPRPRLVEQSVEAVLGKAPTPLPDGLCDHPFARRYRLLLSPAAQPNTMRARNANACAVLRRCV